MHVNDLLKIAVENGASDLHLKVGSYPMMRVRGALLPATDAKKLDHEDLVAMSAAISAVVTPIHTTTVREGVTLLMAPNEKSG